jgi:hypothetical protein
VGEFSFTPRMMKRTGLLYHGKIMHSDLALFMKLKDDAVIKAAVWWRSAALAFMLKFKYTVESGCKATILLYFFWHEGFPTLENSCKSLFNY